MSDISKVTKTNQKFLYVTVAISAVILVTVIVLALLGVFSKDDRTDQEKLVDATIQTMLSDAKTMDVTISIEDLEVEGLEGMEAQVLQRVIKDLSIELEMADNSEAVQLAFSLGMSGINIIDGMLYADSDVIAISVPSLYEHVVYIETKDMANLMGDDMMPAMTDAQKEAHETVFEDIKASLLERDYEAIQQLDFVGYYSVLTAFIETIMTQEMMTETDDDETLMHYEMSADFMTLMSIFGDMKDVYDTDEALQGLIEKHQGIISMDEAHDMMDGSGFALDESFNGLDQMSITSNVYVDESEYISRADMALGLPLPEGIPGLIDYPLDVVIGCEAEITIESDGLIIEQMDLSDGVNIGVMTPQEMEVFLAELMTSIETNLSENQLFKMMGIDPSLLFGE